MNVRSTIDHTPAFTVEDAAAFARRFFGVDASVSVLPGERDQNFRLDPAGGPPSVLKIANGLEDRALLEAQNRAMERVFERTGLCQRLLPAANGGFIVEVVSAAGRRHWARHVSWVEGEPFGTVRARPPALLYGLGRAVGLINAALSDFDHPALHRDLPWDFANALRVIRGNGPLIGDSALRSVIDRLASDFEAHTVPRLQSLRMGIAHNDANDHNVIVARAAGGIGALDVRGIIDFGDMLFGWTIGDLAVAIAYAVLDHPDPLHAACHIVRGCHETFELTGDEIAVVFDLARMRLCMSACMAAVQQAERPEDPYLAISQEPIRRTLPVLASISGRLAEAMFRHACGLTPVPAAHEVRAWLESAADAIGPVLDSGPHGGRTTALDLAVDSPLVSGDPARNEEPALTARLIAFMHARSADTGVARYDEARLLNTGAAYEGMSSPAVERRTVHLGIDLYRPAGTPVMAPLAGTVFAFADNSAPQDYGPVLVLEHRTGGGTPFYTLYGHLGRSSLIGLFAGREIMRGERIGAIGGSDENGGWTPHLHVQLIVDPLDLGTDFPGICRASEREVWKELSPDPNLVLRLPDSLFPQRRPSRETTLSARRTHVGPNLSLAYRDPVKIVRGWMQYLYDETGRRYIDAYNNVPHVGHCHPRVVEAGQQQMAILNTNTRYLHDALNTFADRLAATLPEPLSVCWFVNSASEANELALRLARAHTGRHDTIVLDAAYHGHTTTLIDISPYKHAGPGGRGAPSWVHTAPIADPWRGPYKADDPRAGERYAAHVQAIIERLAQGDTAPAAFIAESCPSVGGQIIFPPGYLDAVYRHVRAAGGVCIADEVQTGYGRIGTHFYAFEAQNVVPDIVVLGKPIGNGHPIAAVVTTPGIAKSFDTGMEFFSTFGGNTVSCAIGLAVLDVLQEEQLQQHALRVGSHLLDRLRPLADRHPIVGNVRGSGLFLGVELVRDLETLEPAGEEAAFVCNRMRDNGILIGTDGPAHNVLKIRPPMPFDVHDADALVTTLDRILAEAF